MFFASLIPSLWIKFVKFSLKLLAIIVEAGGTFKLLSKKHNAGELWGNLSFVWKFFNAFRDFAKNLARGKFFIAEGIFTLISG